LRRAGIEVLDVDPPPEGISATLAARYGFGHASLRAGRLDHLRQVRQLVEAALSDWRPRNAVWLQPDGSLIDGLRATVDPHGLADPAAAHAYRDAHLAAARRLFTTARVLILSPSTTTGLFDPDDNCLYPDPPETVTLSEGLRLSRLRATPEDLDADFAAIHATLRAHNPDLHLHLMIRPAGSAHQACEDEAILRSLAASWQIRLPGVTADPLLDHLLDRFTAEADKGRDIPGLGHLIAGLLTGGDLASLLAAPAQIQTDLTGAPAGPVADKSSGKAARRERRRNRDARRQKGKSGSVVCEDELLEAFS
jgi:hypothetical protein